MRWMNISRAPKWTEQNKFKFTSRIRFASRKVGQASNRSQNSTKNGVSDNSTILPWSCGKKSKARLRSISTFAENIFRARRRRQHLPQIRKTTQSRRHLGAICLSPRKTKYCWSSIRLRRNGELLAIQVC